MTAPPMPPALELDALAAAFDATPIAIAMLDRDLRFVRVNRAYAANDQREPAWFVGKGHFEVYPNAENEVLFRRVIETGEPHFARAKPFEYAEHPERGTTYWDWSLVPVRATDGAVRGAVLSLVNVTDRIRAAELAQALVLQRAIVDGADSIVVLCDPDGRVRLLNRAAQRTLGVREEEVLGTAVLRVARRDDVPIPSVWIEPGGPASHELVEGDVASGAREAILIAPDGREVPLLLSTTVLRDSTGRAVGCLAIGTDLSERRRAEAALRASEARQRAIIETTAVGIIMVDEAGRIALFNPAAERLFGWTSAEVLGSNVALLVAEPHVTQHPSHVERFVRGDEPNLTAPREVLARCRDGSTIPVEVMLRRVPTPEGKLFVTAAILDLREQKQLERAKDEFISTVSHELRTPLTSIRGALGLLEGGRAGELSALARELVTIARSNADRLGRLVDDLLDIERMAAGKLRLECAPCDPASLVHEAAEQIRAVAEGAGVTIVEDVPSPAPVVRGDRYRLLQVLTNFLSNAIRFSPRGETVALRVQAREGRVRFVVADRGPGIAEADVPKLFVRFSRLHSSDSAPQGGSGLGLAISKGIVEQHGGTTGVDTRPGAGSAFWFELPVASPEERSGA